MILFGIHGGGKMTQLQGIASNKGSHGQLHNKNVSLPKEGVIMKGCGFYRKSGLHNVCFDSLCQNLWIPKRILLKLFLNY